MKNDEILFSIDVKFSGVTDELTPCCIPRTKVDGSPRHMFHLLKAILLGYGSVMVSVFVRVYLIFKFNK